MSTKGYNGRDLYITLDDTKIAAVTTKTITLNKEPVDVTTDDSSGFRSLLDEAGTKTLDISAEGVINTNNEPTLMNAYLSDTLSDIDVIFSDGGTLTAADGFFINSFERTGESAGAVTFTISLQSSGEITYTAAS